MKNQLSYVAGSLILATMISVHGPKALFIATGIATERHIIDVVADVRESVVTVTDLEETGHGSGVAILNGTYILTNNHVVDGLDLPYIYDRRGNLNLGVVVCNSKQFDLALIKTTGTYKPASISSATLGETSIAVGSPLILNDMVTFGRVARYLNSKVLGFKGVVHTATLNPGNSGGGLFNLYGELIGINDAKVMSDGAINIAISKESIDQFLQFECGGKL